MRGHFESKAEKKRDEMSEQSPFAHGHLCWKPDLSDGTEVIVIAERGTLTVTYPPIKNKL